MQIHNDTEHYLNLPRLWTDFSATCTADWEYQLERESFIEGP